MSLEFKWEKFSKYRPQVYEPVEVDDDFQIIFEDKRGRKLISNGRVAFEIIARGKLYDQLLLDYELKQQLKSKLVTTVSVEPLPQTIVPEEAVKPEPVEQVVTVEVIPPVSQVDEQTEAEQFVEAVTDYQLSPDDWFECVVQRVSNNGRALILQLENATATCVPRKVTESPGDHKGACLVGLTGAVRLEIVGGVYRALELQILKEPSVLRETAKVTWREPARNIFKAVRPCGCQIFIAGILDEVIYGEINVGDEVTFELERSRSKGNWIGLRAKKISPRGARNISDGI
jgi:hypothetical protein